MGSSISAIDDDYRYYEDFIKFLGVKEKDKWYPHFHEIVDQYGKGSKYTCYGILKEKYDKKQ